MHLGNPLGHDKPSNGLLDRLADGQRAVIAQDAELRITERSCDPFAAVCRHDLDLFVVEQRLIEHEGGRLLAEGTERFDVRRPWCPELCVRMAGTDHIGPGFEQRSVDVVPSGVDGPGRRALCVHHVATRADEHQLVNGGRTEGNTPVEQPEMIGQLRISRRDVAVAELAPTIGGKDAVPERTRTFAMFPLLFDCANRVDRFDPGEIGIVVSHPRSVDLYARLMSEPAPDLTGTVVAVHRAATYDFSKTTTPTINLIAGLGVEDDAHLGATVQHRSRIARDPNQPNLRQVHLIMSELLTEVNAHGHDVHPGALGENITTAGIDLIGLPVGTMLRLGQHALIAITGLRNPCKQIEAFDAGLLKQMFIPDPNGAKPDDPSRKIGRTGVMAVVVTGGEVRSGDTIAARFPAGTLTPLERV